MEPVLSFDELGDRYERCYECLSAARDVLMVFRGVIGIGIGPKEINGQLQPDEPCLILYVEEKKPGNAIPANAFLPKEFCGVKTDVVQVGRRKQQIHNEIDARWLESSSITALETLPYAS